MARIRWGNVGRLAALVVAGVLLATGPRSCSEPRRLPAALPVPPPAVDSGQLTVDRAVAPAPPPVREVPVRRKRRVRHRKPRPTAPKPRPTSPKPVVVAEPVVRAAPPPATGEFGP